MYIVHNLSDYLIHLQAKVMRQRQERDILPVRIFARRNDLDCRLEFVSLCRFSSVGVSAQEPAAIGVKALCKNCLNCPTGKSLLIFRNRVKPRNQKYFASRLTQIRCISEPVPCPQEGRFAIVTDVGCGMRWTPGRQAILRRTKTPGRTAKSCGPDAATVVSSWREVSRRRRWQETPLTGESTYKP